MMTNNKVKIIIGSHGSGKSDWIYNRFLNMSRKEDGKIDFTKKFYLVVPEQDTNDRQRAMLEKARELGFGAGIMNIDVVSFDRIAHNVFDILGIEPVRESVIDDDVKTMILTLVLSKLSKEGRLLYCNSLVGKVGFATKLTKAMSEFYAYNVTDEDVDKVLNDSISDIYKDRLTDLKNIFNEFKTVLSDLNFSIKEDKYDLLNKKISEVDIFNNAVVAFDGFTGFTPIQLEIFKKIANVSSEVYVNVDMRDPDAAKTITTNTVLDMNDVFYLSKKFVKDIMKATGIVDAKDIVLEENIHRENYKYNAGDTEHKADLLFLEKSLYENENNVYTEKVDNIECYVADNVKEEVRNAVEIVLKLVRKEGYKYNDIRILVSSVDDYRDLIIKTFAKYNIPLFIDDSENVIGSPYIECIRAAIDVVNFNFNYDSVMRYLGSGIIEKDKSIYDFNNFLVRHGVRGYDRYKFDVDRIIKNTDEATESMYHSVEVVMNRYIAPLIKLYEDMHVEGGKSLGSYITALQTFIKKVDLNSEIDAFAKALSEGSEVADIDRMSRVIELSKKVLTSTIKNIATLEQYKKDNGIGDFNNVDVNEFKNILDIGLSSKSLKSIPYSLDQVVVGDLTRTRFENPKVEIFLGLNDSKVPKRSSDSNLIDDTMRDLFSKVKELSQTTTETALNQRFYIYLALTNPTDKLILSYSKRTRDGEADEESQVLSMIRSMYKDLKTKHVSSDDFTFFRKEDLFSYIASNVQNIKKHYVVDDDGNLVYHFDEETEKKILKSEVGYRYLKDNDMLNEYDDGILFNRFYGEEKKLEANINADLLSLNANNYETSATSVESYNRCPYKYFMEHTLKLREEKKYAVEAYDIGNIAHKVFENLFKDPNIAKDTKEDVARRVDESLDEAYQRYDVFNEFNKNDKDYYGANKLEYIKSSMRKLMHTASDVLIDIAKTSKSKVDGLEQDFSYNISDDDKKKIMVGGKIDRIDILEVDGVPYVSIIDYKSGKKDKMIKPKDIENGTDVQLTLYMDYCLNDKYKKDGVEPVFVGLFYYWVADPYNRIEGVLTPDMLKGREKKKGGLGGIANAESEVVESVFDGATTVYGGRGKSQTFTKDDYKIANEYISRATLDERITTMREKVIETINNMHDGVISAKSEGNICNYCPYSNICKKERIIAEEESLDE